MRWVTTHDPASSARTRPSTSPSSLLVHSTTMSHPYYPPTLSLPAYTPPIYTPTILISIFSILSVLVLSLAWQLMTIVNPSLTTRAKATASWFLYCGLLHIHFEGYFVKYRNSLASRSDLVGELWKEYALSDSRYLLRGKGEGEFVLGIEVLTVVSEFWEKESWGGLTRDLDFSGSAVSAHVPCYRPG